MASVTAETHFPSVLAPFLCKPGVTSVNFEEWLQLYKRDKTKHKVKVRHKCAKCLCGAQWMLNAEKATIQHCAWTWVSIKIQNLLLSTVQFASNSKYVLLLNFLILLFRKDVFLVCACGYLWFVWFPDTKLHEAVRRFGSLYQQHVNKRCYKNTVMI